KQIAANLSRTVTSVRWKIQHLEMIGVRDLSALARVSHPRKSAAAAAPLPAKPRRASTVSKATRLKAVSSRRAEAKAKLAAERRIHVAHR
ncbi:hypothetical protein ABTA35_19840, partial [Acinetobacter baumannii]